MHHHGAGHRSRFEKIADASTRRLTPISELDLPGGVCLPSDVVTDGVDPTAGGALHWAPVGDPQSSCRAHRIGQWLTASRSRGVVVDVSVETALLCRLFGVPTIVVRQHGDRTDLAHVMAYRSAVALLAPFPRELEHASTPDWVAAKTTYAGFITGRRDDRRPEPGMCGSPIPAADDAVILWGAGGGTLGHQTLVNLVELHRPNTVWFAGPSTPAVASSGARDLGWVDDVAALLVNRPLVVASAGNNVVADVANAGAPLVAVPQDRPFDEQCRHAESLDASLVAGVVDAGGVDDVDDWRRAIDHAHDRRSTLHALARSGGAEIAAATIHRVLR